MLICSSGVFVLVSSTVLVHNYTRYLEEHQITGWALVVCFCFVLGIVLFNIVAGIIEKLIKWLKPELLTQSLSANMRKVTPLSLHSPSSSDQVSTNRSSARKHHKLMAASPKLKTPAYHLDPNSIKSTQNKLEPLDEAETKRSEEFSHRNQVLSSAANWSTLAKPRSSLRLLQLGSTKQMLQGGQGNTASSPRPKHPSKHKEIRLNRINGAPFSASHRSVMLSPTAKRIKAE